MTIYTEAQERTDYYVYAYLRKDGTPYYIGKGTGRRATLKARRRVPRPKELSRIVYIARNLTNFGALAMERRMIEWWGRKDLGTGILHNMTEGGDGCQGLNDEQREKISNAMRGRKFSEEHKRKIGEANRKPKPPRTPEHEEKMRVARIEASRKRVSVDGVEYQSLKNAAEAHGITPSTAIKRLRSENFPGWLRIDPPKNMGERTSKRGYLGFNH